jgi:hypothetical protein
MNYQDYHEIKTQICKLLKREAERIVKLRGFGRNEAYLDPREPGGNVAF